MGIITNQTIKCKYLICLGGNWDGWGVILYYQLDLMAYRGSKDQFADETNSNWYFDVLKSCINMNTTVYTRSIRPFLISFFMSTPPPTRTEIQEMTFLEFKQIFESHINN